MDKGKQAMENMKNIKMPPGAGRPALALVKVATVVGAVAYGAYHSIYNVPAGHRAVIYSRIDGVGQTVMEQGTHFLLPWLQRPITFDVRTRPHTYGSITGTKDLQMINLTIRVLSKPDRGRLQWIYTHLGLGASRVACVCESGEGERERRGLNDVVANEYCGNEYHQQTTTTRCSRRS